MIQIGARNMQNYTLLTEVGRTGKPVLLKRGLSATLDELLMAAEYVLKEGNPNVMLCERGIRTFETAYRFTLDLLAIPALRELTHLPIVIDPSHAAGRRDWVPAMSLAAAAAGADGIIVEVHNDPEQAICDGPQALRDRRLRRVRGAGRGASPRSRARLVERSERVVKIAVLGVGLIGGSIGLAARQRLGAEVAGFDPTPNARARARARGARLAPRRASPRRSADADVVFCAAPVGALPGLVAEALAASGDGAVVTDVGSTKRELIERRRGGGRRRAVHRRAPARGRRDRGGRERPRRAVRGRALVPDPDRALERRCTTTACSARSPTSAPGRRRSTPRPTTG